MPVKRFYKSSILVKIDVYLYLILLPIYYKVLVEILFVSSQSLNWLLMEFSASLSLPSKRNTRQGVVLEALTKPQQFS
jgi:hypothetical protein